MKHKHFMFDLVKLANSYNGRIPNHIPDHYVQWAQSQLTNKNKNPLLPNVIRL